ncbi:hypothetical protein [Phyllobacterium sp. YR531]|uniref:hypothetical protein n=1 Tax=Phyllobacterium sp. YR531 TaxID=1144343 RepID=UPI00026F4916|nr:hypothetical protein [Phyllobacterium sp. YR531]EJN05559.1 hypothetical protein PMI41_00765 [Phyllobacterium sp. YR531]
MSGVRGSAYHLAEGILIDGVQRNKDYPDQFWMPPQEQRERLQAGQSAKVGLEIADTGERFWVIITRVERQGESLRYWGRVDNDLQVFVEDPDYEVCFGPANVLDTDPES